MPAFSDNHQIYIEKNKLLAQDGAFSGKAIMEWPKALCLENLVKFYSPTHWLDYGCGPGTAYGLTDDGFTGIGLHLAEQTHSKFTLYDPCFEQHNKFPEQKHFPGVMCVDVLEHIPESETKATLDYLFDVCEQWMFLFISTKKYAKRFRDEHASTHCTLKTRSEWVNIIHQYAKQCDYPVILGTDYQDNTFEHTGKYMTYDDWNMPAELQEQIKTHRQSFIDNNPDRSEIIRWPLTESNFN